MNVHFNEHLLILSFRLLDYNERILILHGTATIERVDAHLITEAEVEGLLANDELFRR